MTFSGREIRPWYSGIAAVLLGLLILFTLTAFPAAKYFAVEAVNAALYYPEKPVLYIRGIIQLSGSRVLERATLRERVKNLELQNRAMAEALQRAALNVPPAKYSYVSALVTLRYPEDWWQEFRIDKGEKDGVKEGAA
ncbi:MAG: rod shape-determining protein MreC, partial [Synergistes sp.]|nr:rod shape-determining protein MreC [Synergistes sp.]